MKKISSIIATTHLDAHNEIISREALEDSAESVNKGNKPLLTIEHDVTIPPYGKMLTATVEKQDDGEYQLVAESEIFDDAEWSSLDNVKLFRQESKTNSSSFVDEYAGILPDGYEVMVGRINFQSSDIENTFFSEAKESTDLEFTYNDNILRKAAIPDPEIIIKLAQSLISLLLARDILKIVVDKTLDKVSDKVTDDFAKFYEFVKTTILKYAKYAHPKNRPITYVFVVPTEPRVELVAKTSKPNFVLDAITLEKIRDAIENAEHFEKIIGATKIQFLLNENGDWEFNYLLTKTGGVIGTEKAYSNRAKKFELLVSKTQKTKHKK
jgi:hypothetical protein